MAGGTDTTDDVIRAAALCAQLPKGARTRGRENPDEEWKLAEQLLRAVEYDIRSILWAVASKKGTKRPKPIELPSESERLSKSIAVVERSRAEVDAILADVMGQDGGDEKQ